MKNTYAVTKSVFETFSFENYKPRGPLDHVMHRFTCEFFLYGLSKKEISKSMSMSLEEVRRFKKKTIKILKAIMSRSQYRLLSKYRIALINKRKRRNQTKSKGGVK